jgi:hypothetical protein
MQKHVVLLVLLMLVVIFVGGCTLMEEQYSVKPLNNSGSNQNANQNSNEAPATNAPEPPQNPPPQANAVIPGKEIVIDSYTSSGFTILNVGKQTIQTSELGVYVNNISIACEWNSPTMPIYTLRTCAYLGNSMCKNGNTLTVKSPSNSPSIIC